MFCKNCGSEMNDNQAICLKCGVATGNGSSYCSNCGNALDPNAVVCLKCGVAVQKTTPTASPINKLNGQDKITMALVCLFLGGIGIHNFMMGETKKGVTKIILAFCFGLGGILALIDLIKILTDKYEANPEKFF